MKCFVMLYAAASSVQQQHQQQQQQAQKMFFQAFNFDSFVEIRYLPPFSLLDVHLFE